MSISRKLVLITLPILSALGLYNTFYTARLNGTGRLLFTVLRAGPAANLPGTDAPLLRKYTGVAQVDEILTLLITFFAHCVDGSLQSFGKYGVGQFGAGWAVLVMEGLREGNKGRLVSWTGAFGLLIQIFAFTCMTPLYLFLTILTSPASSPVPPKNSMLIESTHLKVLPLNIFVSYLAPSILMSLKSPQTVNFATHQRLIALWQIFPALTTTFQYVLTRLSAQNSSSSSTIERYVADSKTARKYMIALSAATHFLPLFRALRSGTFIEAFAPFSLINSASTPILSLANGVKNFLQWDIYIGVCSILIWAVCLYWETRKKTASQKRQIELLPWWQLVFIMILGGPLSLAVVLLGEREKMILGGLASAGRQNERRD